MPHSNGSEPETLGFARRLLTADISRRKLIEGRPSSFVQWYIALELFIASIDARPVVITDLVHLAGNPRSTTLKAIADLVDAGALVRTPDPVDRRRVFLTLETHFHGRVETLLTEIMESDSLLAKAEPPCT